MHITPMLCGSAFKNKGVQTMLNMVCAMLPSPLDVAAIEGINPKTEEKEARKAILKSLLPHWHLRSWLIPM